MISCTREDTDAGHSGGSTIFIKDAPYLTCTYARSFSPSEDCQICQVMINQITYICVYRSPSQKKSDVDKLTAFMKSLNEFPNLVVLGDLNIPSANWELMYTEDPDHRELVETFAELQVWNYVNVPTHRQGNILDLVLAQNNLVSDVQVDSESHFVSDHYPIVFIIENMQTEAIKNTMIKNHSLFDQEKYVSILRSTTWTLLDFSQVDTAVEQITSIVREAYDVCLPRFMASTHQEKKRFSPKTSAQISLVKYLTKHNGYAPGLAEAKRKLQEMLEKDRIAWQESYMKYLAKDRKNIYNVMSKKHFNQKIMCTRRSDSSLTYDSKEIADILSRFYSSVFLISGSHSHLDWDNENDLLISDIEVTSDKVQRAIRKVRRSHGVGPDGLSTSMFKDSQDTLILPLEILFRKILNTGEVPSAFKLAYVMPLPKKLDSSFACNTRGINIESVFGKLLEKIVSTEIADALESTDFFPENQYGFRRNRSVEQNLDIYHTFLHESLEEGYMVCTCFADLSKAFDLCDHRIVLESIYKAGIRGKVARYIQNWLSNRRQYVKFNEENSEMCDVTSSVVQGSNLGPLLFLIMKSDLNDYIKHSVVQDFADDTKISIRYRKQSELWKIQEDISGLYQWSLDKRQKLNATKTVIVNFGGEIKRNLLFVNNFPLNVVEEVVDLGLITNSVSGYRSHHLALLKKMRIAVNAAKLSTKGSDFATKCMVWNIYLRGTYLFMNSAWHDKQIASNLDKLYASYFEDQCPTNSETVPLCPSQDLLLLDIKKLSILKNGKTPQEFRNLVKDVMHRTNYDSRTQTDSMLSYTYQRARPSAFSSRWPVTPLFDRVCVDWNNVLRSRVPLNDKSLRQYVCSAESSAAGGEIRDSLINHSLLSNYTRRKRRQKKLKQLQELRCREQLTSNSFTDNMSWTSSVEVIQDDFRASNDFSHFNGQLTNPLQNAPNENFDGDGGQNIGPNQNLHQPPQQPGQPGNQQNLNDQLRTLADLMLERVDGGAVAHHELVQDALHEYNNEVGLAGGNANDGALNEARHHLHEVSSAVTQELLNDIIGELQLNEHAANSLRVLAGAIMRGTSV